MPLSRVPYRVLSDLRGGNRVIGLGDSITESGSGYWRLSTIFSNSRLLYAGNAGVGGEYADAILARVDSDVLALTPRPDYCIVLSGTNSIADSAFTPAGVAQTVEDTWRRLRGSGVQPIACTIPPRNAVDPARVQTLNRLLSYRAERLGLPVLDFYRLLVDPSTGDYLSSYTSDGTHPTIAGYRVMGQLVADQIAPFLPPAFPYLTSEITDAVNLLTNGVFVGDSNADGVANNWSLAAAAGDTTPSLVSDATIKGNWQRLTTTASAGQRYFSQTVNMSGGNFAVGDRVAFAGRIRTTNLESGNMGVILRLTFYSNSTIIEQNSIIENVPVDIPNGGVFYEEYDVPVGTTKIQVLMSNGSSGTGVVEFAQMTVVNLTTLGLA